MEVTEPGVAGTLLGAGPTMGPVPCLGSSPARPSRPRPAREGWAGPAGKRADLPARCSAGCPVADAAGRRGRVSSCLCCVPAPSQPDARDTQNPGNRGRDTAAARVLPPPCPRAPRLGGRPPGSPEPAGRSPGGSWKVCARNAVHRTAAKCSHFCPRALRPGANAVGWPLPVHGVSAEIGWKFAFSLFPSLTLLSVCVPPPCPSVPL